MTDSSLTRGSALYGASMVNRLASPRDDFVTASFTNTSVSARAALQADGSVAVMLINLSSNDSADATINISGAQLDSQGTEYLLVDGIRMSQSAAMGLRNNFTVSVPARAIVTYVIPAMTGDCNHDGLVDAADYVLWRHNGSSSQKYALWRQNFGNIIGGAASASSPVPEPSSSMLALLLVVWLVIGQIRK
ncbi:MAG TPA: glycoside hydrolase family 30 beta sandwich domain-containing protein [Lacipirellulaceae bacterium]|nr:glycoside hydrolase family 30 beta sandwich domain-containing protein [Lacipirellulaceae bacterium]